jgi:hypothetical protein
MLQLETIPVAGARAGERRNRTIQGYDSSLFEVLEVDGNRLS